MEKEVTEIYTTEETEEQQNECQSTDVAETTPPEKTNCRSEAGKFVLIFSFSFLICLLVQFYCCLIHSFLHDNCSFIYM